MPYYSREFKQALVVKLCSPEGPLVKQLSAETGISMVSLYEWVHIFGRDQPVSKSKSKSKSRKPEDWSAKEKLQAIFEAEARSEAELGKFLRQNGLHNHHIELWKTEALLGFGGKKSCGRPQTDPTLVTAQEKIKKLERDLRRKEKALTKQTTLVMLQKKFKIFGGTQRTKSRVI